VYDNNIACSGDWHHLATQRNAPCQSSIVL
jgi:hypothetical protein